MKIYVLIENTSDTDLVCEHGLSIFIEYNGKKILLDAGASDSFMDNAVKMGVPVNEADFCVLSHGHYDHSGGFGSYFSENPNKKLYAMNTAIGDYYSASKGNVHEIGIPKNVYPAYKENFVFVDKAQKLSEGVYVIPHTTKGLEDIGERAKLYRSVDGELQPDDFSHEMSLVFETDKGLVVFNSCSHSGITVIMRELQEYFGKRKVHAFFGGLHMYGEKDGKEICTFSENEIIDITEYLKKIGLDKLYTGHCTGIVGYNLIKKHMSNAEHLTTGTMLHI